ncbi:7217_t:CDS:2 [Entrophospora sp. SA101]|nr:7217_t:CDS:2 [Entrophospora sp. SA101]
MACEPYLIKTLEQCFSEIINSQSNNESHLAGSSKENEFRINAPLKTTEIILNLCLLSVVGQTAFYLHAKAKEYESLRTQILWGCFGNNVNEIDCLADNELIGIYAIGVFDNIRFLLIIVDDVVIVIVMISNIMQTLVMNKKIVIFTSINFN